jgi:hypothetical protein
MRAVPPCPGCPALARIVFFITTRPREVASW